LAIPKKVAHPLPVQVSLFKEKGTKKCLVSATSIRLLYCCGSMSKAKRRHNELFSLSYCMRHLLMEIARGKVFLIHHPFQQQQKFKFEN
jgi:hypothetical protein